jgi:hypothetical protein
MVLRPTFHAARTISSRYGGTLSAAERVARLDLDVISDIIALGLGYTSSRRHPSDLPERVWRTGLSDDTGGLAEKCILFLRTLASGGRPPRENEELEGASHDTDDPQ